MASPFPRSQRAIAWLALVDVLQNDPYLKKVKVWRTWSGDSQDPTPINDKNCPALRLTPFQDKSGPFTNQDDEASLLVRYETYVSGYNMVDLMDLDEAVFRAVYPLDAERKTRVERQFEEAGTWPTFTKYGLWDERNNGVANDYPLLRGEGMIRLDFVLDR